MSNIETATVPRRIAISGSSGLIGAALSRRLIADGHRVHRIVRRLRDDARSNGTTSAAEIRWDPQHGLHQPDQLNEVDVVVHLAGHSIAAGRWNAAEKQRIRDSRVAATRRLVEQIGDLRSPPSAFISASAIGIYGDRGQEIVDERSSPAGEFLANVASDWEDACIPLREAGIRVVHPRFGIVLASDGGALGKALPVFRWYIGGRIGTGQQYWSWVALEDAVRAVLWMIEHPSASGAYNVVAPYPVTNAEFTNTLARALGVSAAVPVPAWLLRGVLGEMADALLLCSCRVLPRRLTDEGFEFLHPHLDNYLRSELSARV